MATDANVAQLRAEAEIADRPGQRDRLLAIANYLAAATARAERAEAAIQRAKDLIDALRGGEFPPFDFIADRLLAALDSTETVEAAPEPGPIERDRQIARAEVKLVPRWWVRDGQGNRYRMAGPDAAYKTKERGWGGEPVEGWTVCYDFEFRPSSSRFFDAPPFPGQPDAQRPEERSDEKPGWSPITSGLSPAPEGAGRLRVDLAAELRQKLDELRAARQRAAAESRGYLVAGRPQGGEERSDEGPKKRPVAVNDLVRHRAHYPGSVLYRVVDIVDNRALVVRVFDDGDEDEPFWKYLENLEVVNAPRSDAGLPADGKAT